ncbi:unnamed protein product [Hymenolepis diminuta]|uniref:DNA polymerase alpha subunit B n=1 Tax=Hymenolepis diminuta TaxID=6216 RepID=A0A0R3SBN6_HYMDI|nr:unnamed protein product [Hymenolepis diminuta]
MFTGANSEFSEIKDDLSAFGLLVKEDKILEHFSGLSTKYDITTSTLVEKYVAFRHNRGLSDCLSQNDINLFEKENLIPSVCAKTLRRSEVKLTDSLNVLPEEMRKEVISSKNFDEQSDIMSSYLGKSVPKSALKPSNFNVNNTSNQNGRPKSAFTNILCTFSNRSDGKPLESSASNPHFTWRIQPLQEATVTTSAKFMYQRSLAKAEILDSWTWKQVKRIVESLPSSFLESNTEGCFSSSSSQKPRFSLSSVLEISQKSHQQDNSNESKSHPTSALRPIHSRIQTPNLVAGRVAVCPEVIPAEQRLDATNACIIGTRRAGGGDLGKVMLDITTNASTIEYSLYSGQPVVFKASNINGRSLTAFEFYKPQILPVFNVKGEYMTFNEPNLHVAVACGPFTTNTSHEVAPLLSLLKSVKEHKPHVLILLGALVDSSHPLIGEYCDSTFDELFQTRLNTVAEWCHLLKIRLIVVSSWREVCGNPVYPTPPISKPSWALKNPDVTAWYENVTFVWDPCTIKIGPYYIGVSSPDVLFQMSSGEISSNCTGDRLSRLCRHILTSGTYYPVHPAAEELPLDYPLWWEYARLPSNNSPHCVVFPSRLRYFIKDVDGVVCVNPGLTARPSSASGGSYARLVFSSKSPEEVDELSRGAVTIQGEVIQL